MLFVWRALLWVLTKKLHNDCAAFLVYKVSVVSNRYQCLWLLTTKDTGVVNLLGFIGGFFDRKLPKPGKQNDQNTANDVEP